jgi:hypothetical protein
MATFENARKIALGMTSVVETTSYGTPAFKARGKLFARLLPPTPERGDVLVVVVDPMAREALVESQPTVFFVTEHYENYPMVLVRLPKIERALLRELLHDARKQVAPAKGMRARVRAVFLALPDVEEHPSQFSERDAFFIGGREIAHFHDDDVIDIRVGKNAGSRRDWIEVPFKGARDVETIAELAATAHAANATAGKSLRRPRGRRH